MRLIRLTVIASLLLLTCPAHSAVVLQYHHISNDTPPSTSTAPERFAMHLDYLAREGFEVVPLQQLVDALEQGGPLPDKAVAITFDDGYRSVYDTAWPLLRERGWPFTVFVNSEPHDQRKPLFMSWDELRELHGGGATIANHTVSHANLLEARGGEDPAERRRRIESEILGAQKRIAAETGEAVMLFAYPFGEFDNLAREVVADLGYTAFGQHSGPLSPGDDAQALPRFPFGGDFGDEQDFGVKVNSLPMPLANGRAAVRFENAEGDLIADIVLEGPAASPAFTLDLEAGFDASRVRCFASGQGAAEVTRQGSRLTVRPEKPFGPGRSRVNCTAPADRAGRFFWYSQPWFIK